MSVTRADDLLVLRFEFVNLTLSAGSGQTPTLVKLADPAYIVVYLPPQHIMEAPYGAFAGAGCMAGESQLAFTVPPGVTTIPYTLEALLNWTILTPRLLDLPTEQANFQTAAAPPLADKTSLEIPARLFLSPDASSAWAHASDLVTRNGRTELWHTRLCVNGPNGTVEASGQSFSMRAVWSSDFESSSPLGSYDVFLNSGSATSNRNQIVRLSSDWTVYNPPSNPASAAVVPPPELVVDKLTLSALGGSLRISGAWNPVPNGFALELWNQITSLGRDQYIRTITYGYLYPFGHHATCTTITERKFVAPSGPYVGTSEQSQTGIVAYLVESKFVTVIEHDKSYAGAPYTLNKQPTNGREMPFAQRVTILTETTPPIDTFPPDPPNSPNSCLPITINGQPFLFSCSAVDLSGQTLDFSAALIFVPNDFAGDPSAGYTTPYNSVPFNAITVAAQKVMFATPSSTPKPNGTTSYITTGLTFATQPGSGEWPVLPYLESATVRIEALEHLLGSNVDPVTASPYDTTIAFFPPYLANGFDNPNAPNPGLVFAQFGQFVSNVFTASSLMANIPAEKAGGLALPSMALTALSQHLGPVAGTAQGIANLALGQFEASDFFSGLQSDVQNVQGEVQSALQTVVPSLLGNIPLTDLIAAVKDAANFGDQVPKMTTTLVPPGPIPVPTLVRTVLDWNPAINQNASIPILTLKPSTTLNIHALLEKKLDGSSPTSQITGTLKNFDLNFFNVIDVSFGSLTFNAVAGQKVNVGAGISGVSFAGALSFINTLQQYISSFGSGLSIEPSPGGGLDISDSIGLPTVAVGIFSLQNMTLSAKLHLPFTSNDMLMLNFAFCSRSSPFTVTVSIFGGGGYFALEVATSGILSLEAALEFGGSLSLDLVVASGSVSVMAGIYFSYSQTAGALIAGFLDCSGSLSVLGLITISAKFYLQLSYASDGKVQGTASLTVSVSVACFSKSVTMTVQRSFGGSSGDPTFGQLIAAGDWATYGAAFA